MHKGYFLFSDLNRAKQWRCETWAHSDTGQDIAEGSPPSYFTVHVSPHRVLLHFQEISVALRRWWVPAVISGPGDKRRLRVRLMVSDRAQGSQRPAKSHMRTLHFAFPNKRDTFWANKSFIPSPLAKETFILVPFAFLSAKQFTFLWHN